MAKHKTMRQKVLDRMKIEGFTAYTLYLECHKSTWQRGQPMGCETLRTWLVGKTKSIFSEFLERIFEVLGITVE